MARIGDTERLIWEQHATITDLRARLEAAEAERDDLRDEIGNLTMHDAAVEWRKAEAKLARVEATLCSAMCPCCEDIRAALRQVPSDSEGRPQDEEAADHDT